MQPPFPPEPETPPPPYRPQWSDAVRLVVGVFLIIAGIFAFSLLAPVITLLTLSFLLAFVLAKPSLAIEHYTRLPWAAAVLLVYLIVIVVITFAIINLIPTILDSTTNILEGIQQFLDATIQGILAYEGGAYEITILGFSIDISAIIQEIQGFLTAIPGITTIENGEVTNIETTSDTLTQILQSLLDVAGSITPIITSIIGGVTGFLSTALLAVFLSLLILLDWRNTYRTLFDFIPTDYEPEFQVLFQHIYHAWNGFIRGEILIAFVIAILTWLQLTIMGVPNGELVAILVALVSLIPTLGGFIAIIPLFVISLVSGSTIMVETPNFTVAVLVVVVNIIIQQVIWNVIAPKIIGDALDLPIAAIIVGVFLGFALGGILGALLIAPLMSSIRIILIYLIAKVGKQNPFPNDLIMEPGDVKAKVILPPPEETVILPEELAPEDS